MPALVNYISILFLYVLTISSHLVLVPIKAHFTDFNLAGTVKTSELSKMVSESVVMDSALASSGSVSGEPGALQMTTFHPLSILLKAQPSQTPLTSTLTSPATIYSFLVAPGITILKDQGDEKEMVE